MQPQPTVGTVPMHHQIADDLRAQIASGELAPGDKLPSVNELVDRWRCSPGPARLAIDVLKGEGLVTGGRGKPATVRQPPRRIRLVVDWSQEQKNLVLRPRHERANKGAIEMTAGIHIDETVSTHRYANVPADADLAAEFSIAPGTALLRRMYEMTERATGTRLSYSVSHIPVSLIEANPDLLDENNEPWPGGHQHQLYTVGIEIDKFVRSVTAAEPSTGERQKWGMEQGVPLLWVRTRSIDISGSAVEVSDAAYPADRTEISFSENLQRWPQGYPKYDPRKD